MHRSTLTIQNNYNCGNNNNNSSAIVMQDILKPDNLSSSNNNNNQRSEQYLWINESLTSTVKSPIETIFSNYSLAKNEDALNSAASIENTTQLFHYKLSSSSTLSSSSLSSSESSPDPSMSSYIQETKQINVKSIPNIDNDTPNFPIPCFIDHCAKSQISVLVDKGKKYVKNLCFLFYFLTLLILFLFF